MNNRTLSAATPIGVAILAFSSMAVAAFVLLVDPDLAPKLWTAAGLLGLGLLAVWTLARRGTLNATILDQFGWILLISHTVLVARIRDPRALTHDEGLTPQIAAEIAIWCVCLVYSGARFLMEPSRLSNLWGPAAKYATLLTIAAALSTIYAASPKITMAWSLKLVAIILLCCVLFDPKEPIASAERFLTATYWALVFMLGQFVLLGALSPESALDVSPITGIWRVGGFLISATKLSAVAGMVAVLALIDLLSHGERPFGRSTLVFSSLLMLASLGRGGMLATMIAAFLALAAFKRKRLAIYFTAAATIVCLSVPRLLATAWALLSRGQDSSELAGLTGRIPLWENAIDLIQLKPLLGWGYVSGGRVALLQLHSWWAAPHAHNAFLEMLLDLGILGLALLLMLLWKTSSRLVRVLRAGVYRGDENRLPLLSLQVICLVVFLSIEGLLEAGFSGAPRFETIILFGCAFASDSLFRTSASEEC